VALEKKWHRHCLICFECKKPVSDEFLEEDGSYRIDLQLIDLTTLFRQAVLCQMSEKTQKRTRRKGLVVIDIIKQTLMQEFSAQAVVSLS